MEPLSLILAGAAAAGVTGKIAEKFTEFVTDLVRGQDNAVQQKATENIAEFLVELDKRLREAERQKSISDQQVETALSDPDVAFTIRTALIGAARTASAEKHGALARAVAERLTAPAESNDALASTLAVDAIPKLSGSHLRFLGIAAVVYVVRPIPEWFLDESPDGSVGEKRRGSRYASYVEWLRTSLERLHLQVTLREMEIAHLVSTGCLAYERKLRRDLLTNLDPGNSWILDPRATWHVSADLAEFLHLDPIGRDLGSLWTFGLQHVSLTPSGRLIGTAVYESVGGDPTEVSWSRQAPPPDQAIDDAVWDGEHINENFLRAFDRAVKDRAERRVGPWRHLDKA
jgi:hypothetical protein